MKPKTSPIWNYFEELNDSTARCKLCDKTYSRKGRTTTALKSHLKSAHKESYTEFENQNGQIKKGSATPTGAVAEAQPSCSRQAASTSSNSKQEEVDRELAKLIISQDLSIQSASGFYNFFKILDNKISAKEPKYVKTLIFENFYHQVNNKIDQSIGELEKITLTTDVWTEIRENQASHISLFIVTAHGLNKEFQKVSVTLKCEILQEYNTETLSASKLSSSLQQWNIEQSKIHTLVHTRDPDVVKGANLLEIDNVSCIVYQIQCCLKKNFRKEEAINQLLGKVKKVVLHLKDNDKARKELRTIQLEKTERKKANALKREFPIRWNSTLYMLERFLKVQESINIYLDEKQMASFTSDDWSEIEKCVAVLKPIEEFTNIMSSPETTISSVIPFLKTLQSSLWKEKLKSNTSRNFKRFFENLNKKLVAISNQLMKNSLFTISTYLDPRFKNVFFNEPTRKEVETKMIQLINQELDVELNESLKKINIDDSVQTPPPPPPPPPMKKTTKCDKSKSEETKSSGKDLFQSQLALELLEFSFNNNVFCADSISDDSIKAKAILLNYNEASRIPLHEDPLAWWSTNGHRFTVLQPLVRRYLSTPAICVASQKPKPNILLQKGRLSIDKATKRLFLKYNLSLL